MIIKNKIFKFEEKNQDLITAMVRNMFLDGAAETLSYGVIDNVTLSYSGNRLQVADDVADALVYDGAMDFTDGANEVEEYAYDANGNMTKDLNRGIESITYDWNNMPREITFTSGAKTRYTYDAAGRKLRAEYITPLTASANYATRPTPPRPPEPPILPPGPPSPPATISTVCYHGDCVLRDDSLERVLTPNGYIASDTLHYYIKDYQGNVRSVVRQDGAVVESNEYYPYGGLFSATASVQPYKYSSKELDRTHGLDLYDSEARWYDSLLGRTSTMDPLAEKYYSLSPYLWCAGNPVKFIDLDGCEPTIDEAAAIAAHVYGDKADNILIGDWQVSHLILELNYNNPASGFKSNLYERVVNGVVTEYVYATAGTQDGRDWIANVTQLTGLSYQYLKSGENAKAISAALSNMELNFVGHSLGGGEAALNSILTSSESLIGRKAFTFNAAGVSNATKFLVGGLSALIKPENEIIAYITITDPLNIIQNNNYNFIGNNLPDVNGIRHYMIPKCLNGHSIDNFLK